MQLENFNGEVTINSIFCKLLNLIEVINLNEEFCLAVDLFLE